MNSIDQAEVESCLDQLCVEKRVIFAARCASRLFPGYLEFNNLTGLGYPERLRHALNCAWQWAGGNRKAADFRRVAGDIEPLMLDEDAFKVPQLLLQRMPPARLRTLWTQFWKDVLLTPHLLAQWHTRPLTNE